MMNDNMTSNHGNNHYKSNSDKNGSGENQSDTSQSNPSLDLQIARLAYIGRAIRTLGDGISAVASGLALEALERANLVTISSMRSQYDKSKQLELHQQLDDLINELIEIKETLNSD